MWIGSALVLIFVLYLIDKHNRWRQALKLVIGLVVLCIVAVGGFWGWAEYQDYRQEKEQRAEAAVQGARTLTCIDRLKQMPIPKDASAAEVPDDIQTACNANPDATVYMYQPVVSSPIVWTPVQPKAKAKPKPESQAESKPDCDTVPCADSAVVPHEYGAFIQNESCFDTSLLSQVSCKTIAVLKKGDHVQIVSAKTRTSDAAEIYQVKFQQWTGWTKASDLSPEDREGK